VEETEEPQGRQSAEEMLHLVALLPTRRQVGYDVRRRNGHEQRVHYVGDLPEEHPALEPERQAPLDYPPQVKEEVHHRQNGDRLCVDRPGCKEGDLLTL